MKRVVGIGACIAAAIAMGAAPAVAGEAVFEQPENQYEGRIGGDVQTYIGFDQKRRNGKRVVRKVFVRTRFRCPGLRGYEQFPVRGGFAVKRKKFAGVKNYSLTAEGSTVRFQMALKGKVKRKRAKGTIRGNLRVPDPKSGSVINCVVPKRDWKARRGAEIVPDDEFEPMP